MNIEQKICDLLQIEHNFNVGQYSSPQERAFVFFRKGANGNSDFQSWVRVRMGDDFKDDLNARISTPNGCFIDPKNTVANWRYKLIGEALEKWDEFIELLHGFEKELDKEHEKQYKE